MGVVQIEQVSALAGDSARLAMLGWLECVEKGLSDGTINFGDQTQAFIAHAANGRDTLPVGVMTWIYSERMRIFCIYQSYVVPEFRGQGIYSAMWRKAVEAAQQFGAVKIESGTHMRNTAMRAIAARQGRVEDAISLVFPLNA